MLIKLRSCPIDTEEIQMKITLENKFLKISQIQRNYAQESERTEALFKNGSQAKDSHPW